MAPWVKIPSAKPGGLNLIPRTKSRRRDQTPALCPLTSTYTPWHISPLTPGTYPNKANKYLKIQEGRFMKRIYVREPRLKSCLYLFPEWIF